MTSTTKDSGKTYHTAPTGAALKTAEAHAADSDITFFGACFCPFVQRAWIAFEFLEIPYKYYEVDPYKKPKELLEVSPKGLVPGLRLNATNPARSLNESTVILEYLEDLASSHSGKSLLPPKSDPYARALVRLQSDHISRAVVPAFYRFLQAQDLPKQIEGGKEYLDALEGLIKLLQRAEKEIGPSATGLWHEQGSLSLADALVAPWLLRTKSVLKHYRGFELPSGDRFEAWVNRLLDHPNVKSTSSTDQLYLDSYERYAFNRPNTSQMADAINKGRSLP